MNQLPRVLVVEDNEINQIVITGMLEYAGFEVDTANNGQLAIQALEQAQYGLVIMDCLMPVMDGYATTRAIRAAHSSSFDPNVPVLAVTAFSTPDARRRCREAGMDGFISKPVMADELLTWIARQLDVSFAIPDIPGKKHQGVKDPENGLESQAALRKKMFPAFASDAGQWIQEFEMNLAAGQFELMGVLAHKIRGCAAVLGYTELCEIAKCLEVSGKHRNPVQATAQCKQLVQKLGQLIQENPQPS